MHFRDRRTRATRWWSACSLALLAATLAVSSGRAEDPAGPIDKIEEDWELVVGEPDPVNNAPQVFIVTSPTGNLESTYSVFEINNLSLPDYYGGGLQLQTWFGDENLGMKHHTSLQSLSTAGESVTFTVQMRIWDNWLRFRVKDGASQTWGTFGGEDMTLYRWTWLSNLNGYNPEDSVRHSRVGFAGHRVQKLELKRVRYYSGADLIQTQELSRLVHDGAALASQ